MLRSLFARLTDRQPIHGGNALFNRIVADARSPRWYVDGGVADTVDGRFAVLATLLALAMVRLESMGDGGERAGIHLTEQFVAAMDTEIREMGVSDPTIGKQVRTLVAALGKRVELWRATIQAGDWTHATLDSLYRGEAAAEPTLAYASAELRNYWESLAGSSLGDLTGGRR